MYLVWLSEKKSVKRERVKKKQNKTQTTNKKSKAETVRAVRTRLCCSWDFSAKPAQSLIQFQLISLATQEERRKFPLPQWHVFNVHSCPGLLCAVSSTWIWFWGECGRERLESLPQETMDIAWVFLFSFFYCQPDTFPGWCFLTPQWDDKMTLECGTSCWPSNLEGSWKGCHCWPRLWSHVGCSQWFP